MATDVYQDPVSGLTVIDGKRYSIDIDDPRIDQFVNDIRSGKDFSVTSRDGVSGQTLTQNYSGGSLVSSSLSPPTAAELAEQAENLRSYQASVDTAPQPDTGAQTFAYVPGEGPAPTENLTVDQNGHVTSDITFGADPADGILDPAAFDAEAARQGLVSNDSTVVNIDNDLGIIDPDTIFDEIGLENLEQTAPGQFSLLGSRVDVNKPVPKNWDDWRVRLSLGPDSNYLYKTDDPAGAGILYPLIETDGIIFPYTPLINIQYNANYQNYEMVHSNYLGYFYKGSAVTNLNITATFTAQDTQEANYMLASLHFLRSCTKMFYGQDVQRGMPPPMVFLSGLGEYNFNNHPCVITLVNYNLPNDVDYIPAGIPPTRSTSPYQNEVPSNSGHHSWSSQIRLKIAGLFPGAQNGSSTQADNAPQQSPQDLDQLTKIYEGKTYVPTKIDINFTLIPIQTREQVSKEFSLREYANGKLLKKGFW